MIKIKPVFATHTCFLCMNMHWLIQFIRIKNNLQPEIKSTVGISIYQEHLSFGLPRYFVNLFHGVIASMDYHRSVTGQMTGYTWMFDPGFALAPLPLRFLSLQVDASHESD